MRSCPTSCMRVTAFCIVAIALGALSSSAHSPSPSPTVASPSTFASASASAANSGAISGAISPRSRLRALSSDPTVCTSRKSTRWWLWVGRKGPWPLAPSEGGGAAEEAGVRRGGGGAALGAVLDTTRTPVGTTLARTPGPRGASIRRPAATAAASSSAAACARRAVIGALLERVHHDGGGVGAEAAAAARAASAAAAARTLVEARLGIAPAGNSHAGRGTPSCCSRFVKAQCANSSKPTRPDPSASIALNTARGSSTSTPHRRNSGRAASTSSISRYLSPLSPPLVLSFWKRPKSSK